MQEDNLTNRCSRPRGSTIARNMKTIIIGNSGSGKTWLAMRMAKRDRIAATCLDDIFWESGGFDEKRSNQHVQELIEEVLQKDDWIVEGVFGELVERFLDKADLLIWLDLDLSICEKRLLARESESKKHPGREQSEEGLEELVKWALDYYSRDDMRSHEGHKRMFEEFQGEKMRLRSEEEVLNALGIAQQGVVVDRRQPR